MRAMESARPDRLFEDPYAQAFVDTARSAGVESSLVGDERQWGRSELGALFYDLAIVRTRFFDDFLLEAATAGCRQVVLVAAGLDTRAFRLPWPQHVRVFELDAPEVLSFKQHVLTDRSAQPRCARTAVGVDLRAEWTGELLSAGFRRSVPTVWLAEGLLIYLSFDEAATLLDSVGTLSAPESRLGFEHASPDGDPLMDRLRGLPGADQWTALLKNGLGERAPRWLAGRGWQCTVHDWAALGATYGRGVDGSPTSARGFLTASYEGAY
jgi:methyltransferase (TIGR00027 family)